MKTDEYIKSYFLNGVLIYPDEFKYAMFNELRSLIEIQTPEGREPNIKVYYNNERVLKMKFDGLKAKGCRLTPAIWDEIHKQYLNPFKWKTYPKDCKNEHERIEREKEEERLRKERQSYWDRRSSNNPWEAYQKLLEDSFLFNLFLNDFLGSSAPRVPKEALKSLELDDASSQEEVTSAYRKLALKHHPDKGGNSDKFREITEAKNKLVDYFKAKEIYELQKR